MHRKLPYLKPPIISSIISQIASVPLVSNFASVIYINLVPSLYLITQSEYNCSKWKHEVHYLVRLVRWLELVSGVESPSTV